MDNLTDKLQKLLDKLKETPADFKGDLNAYKVGYATQYIEILLEGVKQ